MAIDDYFIDCVKQRPTVILNENSTPSRSGTTNTTIRGYLETLERNAGLDFGKYGNKGVMVFLSSHFDFKYGDFIIYKDTTYIVVSEPDNVGNVDHHCEVYVIRENYND